MRTSGYLFLAVAVAVASAASALSGAAALHAPGKAATGYPAAGRRAEVNFGATAFRLDFADAHRMSFLGTAGTSKGATDTVAYTAREIRPGLYMVYWHEPKTGNNVVHVQDFTNRTVHTNIAQPDGQFVHLNGTLRLVANR